MSNKFLIIEARFYHDILDALSDGAIQQLALNKLEYERLEVPGTLELSLIHI